MVGSLIPYAFELLDSRSGYPAGIRDPEWQQALWAGGASAESADHATSLFAVSVARELRADGHPAGVPDAREAVRFARDLARLRGLAAPGRRELVEALQTCMAQGEPFGRGRAVARAMQRVLVGDRRGSLPLGAPVSGLRPHVEALVAELRLPGPDSADAVDVRLDPLRSDLDRRREIAIQRLRLCAVPYAEPIPGAADVSGTVTRPWRLRWGPATTAMLEVAGLRGVTLEQAALGRLLDALAEAEGRGGVTPGQRLHVLLGAAEAALGELAWAQAQELVSDFAARASLAEIVEAVGLLDRIGHGHIPGFQASPEQRVHIEAELVPRLVSSAVRQVEGLAGSDRLDDARALLSLVQREGGAGSALAGDGRLRWALQQLAETGSPLMQGVAGALRVLVGHELPARLGERIGSWVDAASAHDAQRTLARRLTGALLVASPLLEAAPETTQPLMDRISQLGSEDFLRRLPALRDGFDALSPAARARFLQTISDRVGGGSIDLRLDFEPRLLAALAEADLHGRAAVELLDPEALGWQIPT